ncbi:MYB-BINDING PROTEIN 1A FAMILY MEMBER [Salix viminalis]|uniref:MYB-BINDING PROTEIN 1A FAMILY MEMBER n=1 Tax=Salix viminalis TaxID=40686 RepID=A0A9Q0NJU0_SALVM|nr:MYB-BINDING PROTEIN 1A FAMILY MEMBER [Salix viminalis]
MMSEELLLLWLLQKHSNARFDGITKTKTVKALVTEFKTEVGCMLFIQNLMSMFVDEGNASEEPSDQSQTTDDNSEMGSVEDKDSNDFLKTWVVESLPSILKHLKAGTRSKVSGAEGNFEVSSCSRMCIEQIQSLLANAQKIEGLHSLSSGLEHGDLGSYFMRFLSTLRNIPSVSLFRSLSDDDEKAFEKLHEMEIKLSREEKNCVISVEANKLHAMRFLLIQLLLQEKRGLDDDANPKLMDVLVDTFLSLLPQSSAPLRSAIEQVFKYFCNDVTNDGLLRMLRVIKKRFEAT